MNRPIRFQKFYRSCRRGKTKSAIIKLKYFRKLKRLYIYLVGSKYKFDDRGRVYFVNKIGLIVMINFAIIITE